MCEKHWERRERWEHAAANKEASTQKTGRKWPRVLKCDSIQNASPGCHFKVESMQKLLVFVPEPPNLYIQIKKILLLNC